MRGSGQSALSAASLAFQAAIRADPRHGNAYNNLINLFYVSGDGNSARQLIALAEKIGVTVKPVWGTWANFNDLASNAINAGSDEYDVMFTCSWTSNEYAPYAKKGAFVRLDDPEDNLLDEYGKDVEAALPALLLEGAKTEGEDGE